MDGLSEPWVPAEDWNACKGAGIVDPASAPLVWCIDQTPGGDYASITAAQRQPDGTIQTELVASLRSPSLDRLFELAKQLRKIHGRGTWVMYGYTLNDLAERLRGRGMEVHTIRGYENSRAAGYAYAAIKRHEISHNGDQLLERQQKGVKVDHRDSGFVLKAHKGHHIDGVMSLVYACYIAGTKEDKGFLVA